MFKLKKCPFCGKKAKMHYIEGAGFYVRCNNYSKCKLAPLTRVVSSAERASKYWNKRK